MNLFVELNQLTDKFSNQRTMGVEKSYLEIQEHVVGLLRKHAAKSPEKHIDVIVGNLYCEYYHTGYGDYTVFGNNFAEYVKGSTGDKLPTIQELEYITLKLESFLVGQGLSVKRKGLNIPTVGGQIMVISWEPKDSL